MDQDLNQLKSRERGDQAAHTELRQEGTVTEYESVEQALRTDRERTHVPEQLAVRVSEAIQREPAKPGSWWSRWFNRDGTRGG